MRARCCLLCVNRFSSSLMRAGPNLAARSNGCCQRIHVAARQDLRAPFHGNRVHRLRHDRRHRLALHQGLKQVVCIPTATLCSYRRVVWYGVVGIGRALLRVDPGVLGSLR